MSELDPKALELARVAYGKRSSHDANPYALREAITAYLSASSLSEAGDEWQPIESSPDEGLILVFDPHSTQPLEIRKADGQWFRWAKKTPGWETVGPSHWRPLPAPPRDEVK